MATAKPAAGGTEEGCRAGEPASSIRLSTPADADPLAEVSLRSWQAAYRGLLPQAYLDGLQLADWRRQWYRNLASTGLRSFLSEWRGQVQGYINLWPAQSEPGALEITALYVHPAAWRDGIGRGLMTRGLAHAASCDAASAYLWVLEGNQRARAFYEHCGFLRSGPVRQDRSFGGRQVREIQYRVS